MTKADLHDLIEARCREIPATITRNLIVRWRVADASEEHRFPSPRDYAYCQYAPRTGALITFSRKILKAGEHRADGLIRHELAHAILLHNGVAKHSEQDCDDMAERVWGGKIRYDADDVQTTGRGNWPRPCYLPR